MADVRGAVRVDGASIYYEVTGHGPPMLILAGGDADAGMTAPLIAGLADRFRVISYDRRGFAHSPIDAGAAATSIAVHADDAGRLLAELADEPALVFGTSIGGFIGLELMRRRPEQVARLVAHEAPSAELLPKGLCEDMRRKQLGMAEAFRSGGAAAAMRRSAELAGVDPEDREPDAPAPPQSAEHARNTDYLLSVDLPQILAYRVDIAGLKPFAGKIVPAAGETSRRTLLHACSAALAKALNRPLAELPGGHAGWLLRPKAFAAVLRTVLSPGDGGERQAETRSIRPPLF